VIRFALSGEQGVDLLEEAGAVGGVHGDELNGDAVTIADAADDGASADLAHGKIEQDLHETAEGEGLFGADEESADGETFDKRNAAFGAGLPSRNDIFGRLYTGITPLIRSVHQGAFRE